jgi:glycosyltransferase involved in cell wall biosynthesis
MRVLAVACESPTPVRDGFTLRVHGLLSALAREHEISLVTYGHAADIPGLDATVIQPPPAPSLRRRLSDAALGVGTGEPAIVRRYRLAGIVEAVAGEAARQPFDVLHLAGNDAGFLALERWRPPAVPAVVDLVDAWHPYLAEEARQRGLRPKLQLLAIPAVRRYERAVLAAARTSVVVGERDRNALLELVPSAPIRVVPNGVNPELLSWSSDDARSRRPDLIVFHGSLDYGPNVDAAVFLVREILPRVRQRVPQAAVRLVGRNPHARVAALAGEAVEITGAVENIAPWITEAAVAVYPMLRGGGIKNKVLEAAGLGMPIVVTPTGLGDIDLEAGHDVVVAATADELAAAIAVLLSDDGERDRLGSSARRAVSSRYSWAAAAAAFTDIYSSLR